MTDFTRTIRFYPAYDKRSDDPKKNYGTCGVELGFYLKGPKGVIQFKVSTNWQLPNVQKETDMRILEKVSRGAHGKHITMTAWGSGLEKVAELLESVGCMAGMVESRGVDEIDLSIHYHPIPTDIGYHSYVPRYEGQTCITESCEWLEGKPCYYDGATLNARPIFEALLREGDEGVWREMEKWYKSTFEESSK